MASRLTHYAKPGALAPGHYRAKANEAACETFRAPVALTRVRGDVTCQRCLAKFPAKERLMNMLSKEPRVTLAIPPSLRRLLPELERVGSIEYAKIAHDSADYSVWGWCLTESGRNTLALVGRRIGSG